MTKLSVNVNKIATIRNARGGDVPSVVQVAKDCELFGADGITIHPRPDERHITTKDVYDLHQIVTKEFNIEGYPNDRFLKLIEDTKPTQATLVPDAPDVLTSNAGWDTFKYHSQLKEVIQELKKWNIRVSLFVDTDLKNIEGAKEVGADRIELYTGPYAEGYEHNREESVKPYTEAALFAHKIGLEINAGHDLSLDNMGFFKEKVPYLDEVSIGHALISEALYLGLEKTIKSYIKILH